MRTTPLLAMFLFAAACGGSYGANSVTNPGTTNTATPTVTSSVAISGFAFSPSAIQVSPGVAVTWTNNDNTNHNVTFTNASIGATPNFASGTQTLTMPTATGTYAFHCTIHAGMTGTVLVQ